MNRIELLNNTRRQFLTNCVSGMGAAALASLSNPAVAKPHFKPRAKRMIYLHMAGSPPHHDLIYALL